MPLYQLMIAAAFALPSSAALPSSGRPTGLFVDVKSLGSSSSYNATVHTALQLICSAFSSPTSPMQANRYLALDHSTFPAPLGFLSKEIDSLVQYFPCFEGAKYIHDDVTFHIMLLSFQRGELRPRRQPLPRRPVLQRCGQQDVSGQLGVAFPRGCICFELAVG